MMTDAERKRLQEELATLQKQRAELQAQLEGMPEGGAKYQKAPGLLERTHRAGSGPDQPDRDEAEGRLESLAVPSKTGGGLAPVSWTPIL
jgi:hypothetical protein